MVVVTPFFTPLVKSESKGKFCVTRASGVILGDKGNAAAGYGCDCFMAFGIRWAGGADRFALVCFPVCDKYKIAFADFVESQVAGIA